MTKITTKIIGGVIAAALLIAAPVSALVVDSETSGSTKIGNSMEDGVDVSVTSETSVESNASASANSETEGSNSATFEVDAVGPTVIIAADIDADADVSVKSSSAVNSKTTLHSYARGVVKANADIRDVSLSDTEVSVSHREKARIFGIFPMSVFARASVSSDGSVKVKFPWYCFAAQKKAALESKVKAAVKSSIPSVSANAEAKAKLSAQTQAQVLEKIVATMKAEFEADVAAKANVN